MTLFDISRDDPFVVDVEDGNAPLKDVFKPDYAKARELEVGRVRLTSYQYFAIRKLERIIKNSNVQQKGVNFIKRRMVVFGMGIIEQEYNREIHKLELRYNFQFDSFNERSFQKLEDKTIIGNRNGKRYMLYLDETDFGRIRELSQVLNLTIDSVERLAIGYSILHMQDYFDETLLNEVRLDIEDLKEYIKGLVNM